MSEGFAKSTYEVYVAEGDRWTIDSVHSTKWKAMDRAQELLESKLHDAVRVSVESASKRAKTGVIFEQECEGKPRKTITISPVEMVPLCATLEDCYAYQSRLAIGRLLRTYLDEHRLTALELQFSPIHLGLLERNDILFPQAAQRIATLHAQAAGGRPADWAGKIYQSFARVKERAKSVLELDSFNETLKGKGLEALIGRTRTEVAKEDRDFYVLGALAAYLGGAAEWNAKLGLMLDLAEKGLGGPALGFADEAIAEILDGASAVRDVLGGVADAITTHETLVRLSAGRLETKKSTRPNIARLNALMWRLDMPLTRGTLLERVQNGIRGVGPLTREGGAANQEAFIAFVRELGDGGGLAGGPAMSEAVVRRTRITLRHGDNDLTMEQGIDSVLGLLADRAVRLGHMLDLSRSKLAEKHRPIVLDRLRRIEANLSSISSLVPAAEIPSDALIVVKGVKERLELANLPRQLQDGFSVKIDKFEKICRAAMASGIHGSSAKAASKGGGNKMAKNAKELDRVVKRADTCIFSEGEAAECAYLLRSGQVEISTEKNGSKIILTTLGPGQIFGELALLDNSARSATARAVSDCELAIVTEDALNSQIEKLEPFLKHWLMYLSGRIRDLTEKIGE